MAVNNYDIGDVVRLTGTFATTAGAALNPTKVTFTYERPTGVITVLTSTMAGVTNPAVGTFYTDLGIDASGVWEYRISSTGTLRTSTQSWFRVRTQRAIA